MTATDSMVWSEEEEKYLKALLSFNSATNGTKPAEPKGAARKKEKQAPPVGEFKILIVGAKGCGKTSILEKVGSGEHCDFQNSKIDSFSAFHLYYLCAHMHLVNLPICIGPSSNP
jgi:hypothetical protein